MDGNRTVFDPPFHSSARSAPLDVIGPIRTRDNLPVNESIMNKKLLGLLDKVRRAEDFNLQMANPETYSNGDGANDRAEAMGAYLALLQIENLIKTLL